MLKLKETLTYIVSNKFAEELLSSLSWSLLLMIHMNYQAEAGFIHFIWNDHLS